MHHILGSWVDAAQHAVASGQTTMLSVVCLLQYVAHVYRQSYLRKTDHSQHAEVARLSAELGTLHQERSAVRFENQLLRELIGQANFDRGIQLFLRRLAQDPARDFALFFARQDSHRDVSHHRGITDTNPGDYRLDDEWVGRLATEDVIAICTRELAGSRFWTHLDSRDRAKVRDAIFLLRLGDPHAELGIIATTALFPSRAERSVQMGLAVRLAACISEKWKHQQQVEAQNSRLKCSAEMFELRQLCDRHMDEPGKLIHEFLRALRLRTQAEQVALYVAGADHSGVWQSSTRSGEPLPLGLRKSWLRHESKLAMIGLGYGESTILSAESLKRLGIEDAIRSAVVTPAPSQQGRRAVLCLTRGSAELFTSEQARLVDWAGMHLAETLQRAITHRDIEHQARIDGLTGLANRRTFDTALEQEFELARTAGVPCSLVLFDLDRFKSVNDTYGHRTGDQVLRAVAQVICDNLGQTRLGDRAMAARYGGEELVVLLPSLSQEVAVRIAEGIRRGIEALRISTPQGELRVTTSAGVSTYPSHASSAEELMTTADAALYHAKATTRNRVITAEIIQRTLANP